MEGGSEEEEGRREREWGQGERQRRGREDRRERERWGRGALVISGSNRAPVHLLHSVTLGDHSCPLKPVSSSV